MQKPRIVVDARMVGPKGHGIGNYVQDIADALEGKELPYSLVFLLSPDCPKDSVLRRYEHAECEIGFLHPKEIFGLAKFVKKLKANLFHSPSFSSLANYPFPYVMTVHDLNHLHFAGAFHRLYYRFLLLPAMRKARGLASVSRTAAAEIEGWLAGLGVKRPVQVVPNSIHRFFSKDGLPDGLSEGNFFFCLSNPKPFKNVQFLKDAYRLARVDHDLPDLVLSIDGEDEPGIRHLGSVPKGELPALLAGAKAFFFPSLYEGFGRPPVEAALAGTLPVVSDIPVHREALVGVSESRFLLLRQEDWVREIRRLAREPKALVSLDSRNWIERTYSLKEVGERADAFYREALGVS